MMNIRSILFLLTAAYVASPLLAQSHIEVGAHYAFIDPSGSNRFADSSSELELDNGTGYGVSVGLRLNDRWSVQGSLSSVDSDATLISDTAPAATFPLGRVELTPFTATLRFHPLGDAALDPYFGAGASWTGIGSLDDESLLHDLEIEEIDFDDEISFAVEAGVRFRVNDRILIDAGAKYVPLKPESVARFVGDAAPGDPVEIELNPIIVTVGVLFRF